LRKLLLIINLLIISVVAKAQYNYSEFGIGGGYGTTQPYADMKVNDSNKGMYFDLFYNYSPYLPFAFEMQLGKLSGGNDTTDPSHRYFVNNYLAFNIHGDLQLGEITEYEGDFFMQRLKGLYMGFGVGALFNNITDIRRYAADAPTYLFPGKDHSVNLLIPVRFGYEFKIYNYDDEPFLCLNINYTHNFTFAEGLDGYDDPSAHFKNNSQDMFRTITVGIKINFGNTASYIKSIK
jgi:hypothetical protein